MKININGLNTLLAILISTLTITGISFFDSKIWDIIFAVVFYLAYSIVGVFIEIGIVAGKKDCGKVLAFVTFLLILLAFKIYEDIMCFKKWLLSWPMVAKILVPVGVLIAIGTVILVINLRQKGKKNDEHISQEM